MIYSLELVLNQVDDIANNSHGGKLQALLTDPCGPLEQLRLELEGIRVALKAVKSNERLGPLIRSLQWPLK